MSRKWSAFGAANIIGIIIGFTHGLLTWPNPDIFLLIGSALGVIIIASIIGLLVGFIAGAIKSGSFSTFFVIGYCVGILLSLFSFQPFLAS